MPNSNTELPQINFWQQTNQRPDWVRYTCLGFGLNALFVAVLLFWGQFRPFGVDLKALGFSELTSVSVAIAALAYMVFSAVSLWHGQKWGLIASFLFPTTFVLIGLFGLIRFLFANSTNLAFDIFALLGGLRWAWELWKLWKHPFFNQVA
jgi:hypothetical protein